ncbi:hypothetical protein V8E55_008039 [Tylopilus felleus]
MEESQTMVQGGLGSSRQNLRDNVANSQARDTIVQHEYKYPLFRLTVLASHNHVSHREYCLLCTNALSGQSNPHPARLPPPVESQSADSDPQSVWPPLHKPLHPPTPRHPYRIYGYKLTNEWFAKIAKDHNIGEPDWDEGAIESAVLGYLTRLPGFQIHFVDDPSVPVYGYSICISLATNWNRKKLERAASRVPKWMEILGTEEKPRWYKPTVETIPPIPR